MATALGIVTLFESLPIFVNLLIFAVAAVFIWQAGTRLFYYLDAIAEQTQIARAFLGLVLLASATELPELVTVLTASSQGNGALAVNNMFGGMLLQIAVIAVADVFVDRGTLSAYPRRVTVIVAGLLSILSLSILLFVHFTGDVELGAAVGLGSVVIAAHYVVAMYILRRSESREVWSPVDLPDQAADTARRQNDYDGHSLKQLIRFSLVAALIILISGSVVVRVSETLAEQTGLGSSFIGVSLLALTTSLPELSTSIAAIKVKAYTMAISNIFGSNLIMTFLLLPADVFYDKGPLLNELDTFAAMSLVAGIVMTSIYCLGFLTRSKLKIGGIGVESVLVLALYFIHLIVLYQLR